MGTPNLRSTPSTKVRWTPSQAQLRVLERLYEEQAGIAPSKEQIKEITTQLSQLGDITDRSVYYWFQNRKARARQKQPLVTRASSRVARPKTRHENRAGRNKRKVREVVNESPEVSSTERPVAHKRRKPKKDEKPKESSHETPHPKRRRGRRPKDRSRNLATNQHGNRESHAEPTISHKSTGVAMDQHSATGSGHGAVQASTLCSNVPAGASGVRSLYNNNDERSNNNNSALQNEDDDNNNNSNNNNINNNIINNININDDDNDDGPIISNTDPQHPRSMQTGTLRFSPGISLAGGPLPSNFDHNAKRRADQNYSRDCSTQ